MTNATPAPSGINFDWILVREIKFVDASTTTSAAKIVDVPADLVIQSSLSTDSRSCRVRLGMALVLPAEGSEEGPTIEVTVEGQFSSVGETSVSMKEFSEVQAPVILLPFLREIVATVSGRTRTGQILLNPMNLSGALRPQSADSAEAKP